MKNHHLKNISIVLSKIPSLQTVTTLKKRPSENIIEKREIGSFQNFALWERVLMTLGMRLVDNIVEKGENAGNQQFLLFPKSFL